MTKELQDAGNLAMLTIEKYFDFAFDLLNYIYFMKTDAILIKKRLRQLERRVLKT